LNETTTTTQVEPCLTLAQYDCADSEVNTFDIISSSCVSQQCPLECDSVHYALKNSVGSTRSQPYLEGAQQFTSMVVYYSSLEYTQITETPQTTLVNLLSQVGGSLGMFVSFSVFTLFEVIEGFVLLVFALIFN